MRSLIFIFLIFSFSSVAQSIKGTIKVKKVAVDTAIYSSSAGVFDAMPAFAGGDSAFNLYMRANLKYPEDAIENGLGGTCYVTFVINKDGTVSNVRILNGVAGCASCDAEALHFFSVMPPWIPGTKNGVPVRVQMNMPIKFSSR